MSKIKLASGQYYTTACGRIGYCLVCNHQSPSYPWIVAWKDGDIDTYTDDGRLYEDDTSEYDLVEHLPDCTGFDWKPKPKMQLREGAWYRSVCGNVIGPCKPSTSRPDRPWTVDGIYYTDEGTNTLPGSQLIEEVPDPNPKPIYRPFASAEEFAPHKDKWLKRLDAPGCFRVVAYDNSSVYVCDGQSEKYEFYFNKTTFEDGTPFGVKVS